MLAAAQMAGPMLLVLALALAGCVVVTPLVAQAVRSTMVDVAKAQFVGEGCPSLSFDTAKARKQIAAIYDRLTASGADPAEIDAERARADQAEIEAQAQAELAADGLDPETASPEEVCKYGQAQKSAGNLIGRLLS